MIIAHFSLFENKKIAISVNNQEMAKEKP